MGNRLAVTALVFLLPVVPLVVHAETCCPSGGNGGPTAVVGPTAASDLGQDLPRATDQSVNTNWHVYMFVRDGIQYFQVNDLNGVVRFGFANIGGQIVVLPMGADADKVVVPGAPPSAITGTTQYVFKSANVNVSNVSNGSQYIWKVDTQQ